MNDNSIEQIRSMEKSCADQLNHVAEILRPTMIAIEKTRQRMTPIILHLSATHSEVCQQMAPIIQQMSVAHSEVCQWVVPIIQQISAAYSSWMKANPHIFEAIKRYSEQAKLWQNYQKQNVVTMAESGWFPNWYTFDYEPEIEVNDVDLLMTMHLNDCWSELTDQIIELCPNRKHILETAFSLHKEGNYIASIPLLISQADGICCEEIKTFFFTGKKPKEALEEMLDTGELQNGFLVDIFLEPYKVKTQFSEGIKKSSAACKKKGPNRHGIFHGYRKHLDYGTELNSLKSLSLLAFVVFSTKDVFKNALVEALK